MPSGRNLSSHAPELPPPPNPTTLPASPATAQANRSLFLTRLALFLCFNVTFASAACLVTLLLSSVAAGSGIPEVLAACRGRIAAVAVAKEGGGGGVRRTYDGP